MAESEAIRLIEAELAEARAEIERLTGELAKRPKSRLGEQVNRLSNAVGDLERERDDALAEVERLRAELAETTHALEVTGEKVTALRKQRDTAEAERNTARAEHVRTVETERDRIRLARDSARRGRKQARGQLKAARPYIDWLHEQRRTLSAERDAAREQVKRVREVIAEARARDRRLLARRDAEPYDRRERRREWESRAHEVRDLADRLDAALGGTEPGPPAEATQ